MIKQEIKKAKDNELIVDYIDTYSILCMNQNMGGGTKRYSQHCHDLEQEMLKRGILTEQDVKHLNM